MHLADAFTTGGLYSSPGAVQVSFIMDGCAIFDVFWTVEKNTPTYCQSNAWKSKDHF